jgi:histidinol-phosphate aminotransferase
MTNGSNGTSALDVARESYRSISLYSPNRAPAAIDLSDNTNLWGIPPAASRAIHDAATSTVTRYPALYAADVKRAIADYVGVDPDMIVTGCGSDDVLDSAIRAFAEPGDTVAYPDPSFAMIPIFAQMNGLEGVAIPMTDSHDVDPAAYAAAGARISYVCSPNNPTGGALSRAAIEQIVADARGVVIVDEAYAEFASSNVLDLARSSSRVLVSRTLSKEDRDWVAARVRDAIENRQRLSNALRAMGLAPLASEANFVLVPVPDAPCIDRSLRDRGVAVRPFSALPRIGDALRISVGPWEMLETCLRALAEVLDGSAARGSAA